MGLGQEQGHVGGHGKSPSTRSLGRCSVDFCSLVSNRNCCSNMNCCCFAPAHVFPLISSTVSFFPTGLLHGRGRKPHKLGLSITSQYIITSQTAEVQVGLLSGRTARCSLASRWDYQDYRPLEHLKIDS